MYLALEESVGFEPTEHFCSTVFKTVALNQTLPTFHMARVLGVEPKIVESKSTVLPLHHTPDACLWMESNHHLEHTNVHTNLPVKLQRHILIQHQYIWSVSNPPYTLCKSCFTCKLICICCVAHIVKHSMATFYP